MDNNKSSGITLTDIIHLQLFRLYESVKNLDIENEYKTQLTNIIDYYGQLLVHPLLISDSELLKQVQYTNNILQSNKIIDYLEKDQRLSSIYISIKNLQTIAENPNEYCKLQDENRFENQKSDILEEDFKNHKIKPLERFFAFSEKDKGLNGGNFNFKRIIEPGNIELDGKTITIGKNHKKFSESKYVNTGLTKYADRSVKDDKQLKEKFSELKKTRKDNIDAIYFYKTVKNNEFYADANEKFVSDIIGVMSPNKHYKIRYIDSDGAMQIKLLKNSISLYELHTKNKYDLKKTYDVINKNSFLDTLIITFLIGIGDRINTNNTMIDINGNVIPIDYTRLIGSIHDDRYFRFEEAILNNNIELVKKILIEDLYADMSVRDRVFKTSNFDNNEITKYKNEFMIQLAEKLLNTVSDEKLLKTIQKFTTKEKIEKIEDIYDDWFEEYGSDQIDLDDNLINQDIPRGLDMIKEAIKINLKNRDEKSKSFRNRENSKRKHSDVDLDDDNNKSDNFIKKIRRPSYESYLDKLLKDDEKTNNNNQPTLLL